MFVFNLAKCREMQWDVVRKLSMNISVVKHNAFSYGAPLGCVLTLTTEQAVIRD